MNNWKVWDDEHKGMKTKAKEIFVGFKGRDGMHPAKADALFDTMHEAGSPDAFKITPVSHQTFKKIVGGRIAGETLDRSEKVKHIQTFENAYNHAGFAITQKHDFSTILKGKGPKGHTWKLVNGKRVYSGGASPTQTPEANAQAVREKYSPIDEQHFHAAQYHRAQAERGDFTHDEKAPHIAAYQAHRAAGSNAQSAMATANHETHGLYANRQEGLSAAAQAATDKTSPVARTVNDDYGPSELAVAQAVKPDSSHVSTPTSHVPQQAQGVNHPNNHMDVAKTIMQQYGGNSFRAMTGANNFVASAEKGGALTFRVPRTAGATKGVKFVKTVHDPASDTYDVHMLGRNGDVKHTATGVYADQLQSHFKHHTGLLTHL